MSDNWSSWLSDTFSLKIQVYVHYRNLFILNLSSMLQKSCTLIQCPTTEIIDKNYIGTLKKKD